MPTPPAKPPAATDDSWTVRRVLQWTTEFLGKHGSETPRLDAEVLLAHARGCRRIELYTGFDDVLSDEQRAVMRDLVKRRAQAEPVAYLVGHREFFGLDFRVTPDVLIPRPDTETLVMELLEAAKAFERPRILDLCTGSGCIAVATAVYCPAARIVATDISEEALAVARENAAAHAVAERIEFRSGDLFAAVHRGERFDLIACNPPYVAATELAQLQPDVRLHEPHAALVGGPDGLAVIRWVISEAGSYLHPPGSVFIEIAPEQADAVRELFAAAGGFAPAVILKDLSGKKRVVTATMCGPATV